MLMANFGFICLMKSEPDYNLCDLDMLWQRMISPKSSSQQNIFLYEKLIPQHS